MSFTLTQAKALHAAVCDVPKRLGIFDKVNEAQVKNAPGRGLSCEVWAQRWRPARTSGLASLSLLVVFNARVLMPADHQPQEDVEPTILWATLALAGGYVGGFTLGGLTGVRAVDPLGAEGITMEQNTGFLTVDTKFYRGAPVVVPVIINDVLEEVA